MSSEERVFETMVVPVVESLTKAEIDSQIATAKQYPRNLADFKRRAITMATLDTETAESCMYSVPREGKMIKGPSIRLAEIVLASYQNMRGGARIVEVGESHITAQGVTHDLENNVCVSTEVRRRITKKNGERYSEDMITTAANAACSIALRNSVFRVIPAAICQPIYEAARKVAIGDASTLQDRRDKAMKAFAAMSIQQERILDRLGKTHVELIDLADLETLLGLHNAIRAGETTVDEAFPQGPPAELKPGRHATKAAPKKEEPKAPEATGQTTEPDGDMLGDDEAVKAGFFARMREAVKQAKITVKPEAWKEWEAMGSDYDAIESRIMDLIDSAKE